MRLQKICLRRSNLFLLFSSRESSALVEAFYTSSSVHDLFISSKERVALATDFHFYFRHSGTNDKYRPTSAGGLGFYIKFWVYIFLHNFVDRKRPSRESTNSHVGPTSIKGRLNR